jgi:hypothetical protein
MPASNTNCSAFQGANVYMDQPIVANTVSIILSAKSFVLTELYPCQINWLANGNDRSRTQILVSEYNMKVDYLYSKAIP